MCLMISGVPTTPTIIKTILTGFIRLISSHNSSSGYNMMPPLLLVNKGLALIRESFIYAQKGLFVHHIVHHFSEATASKGTPLPLNASVTYVCH